MEDNGEDNYLFVGESSLFLSLNLQTLQISNKNTFYDFLKNENKK